MKFILPLILFFIPFNTLSEEIKTFNIPFYHKTINAGGGNDIIIGSDYSRLHKKHDIYNGQEDDDIIIGCYSGGELNGNSGNDILSVFYFSCIQSIYENLPKNSSINLLTKEREKIKIIEKDNYFFKFEKKYLQQIINKNFFYNTDNIYISIENKNNKKLISLTNFLINNYFFKSYLIKYPTFFIMNGHEGDDLYIGSIYEEKITYHSGIDTIFLGQFGLPDSLICDQNFKVIKSSNKDIILFYDFNNMILLKNAFHLDYTLKSVCGSSLLNIFNKIK